MGKRSKAAKASLAAAFLAAGGTVAAGANSAANPDSASVDGIVSSFLGPLGLQDNFQKAWVKFGDLSGIKGSFGNYWKFDKVRADEFFFKFFRAQDGTDGVSIPPVLLPSNDGGDGIG